ncbi:hypothetical protein SEEM031_21415 [Salmonella enterica subsp. enterica serovar Montevideo str. SARB31]|nr:hypothetical protein SEEM031_21415 [Salmonella enterica subsp. enterica serovar Montevideo str. SARB31]ESG79387.1 hypothetical protein SEEJ0721_17556 [Salmonella enterica subsp. enterica serovar Javiana str. 10721]
MLKWLAFLSARNASFSALILSLNTQKRRTLQRIKFRGIYAKFTMWLKASLQ